MPETTNTRQPKNIVICCDGTGNQFGSEIAKAPDGTRRYENNNSNVVRLYTSLSVDAHQVAYYHPGVGTMGNPNSRNRAERWWSKLKGMGFGLGLTDNMADAYRFLMQNYADGDRIYLFGFSRGAYTVRALAGALNLYGLLCPGNEGHLTYLLQMYAQASKEAFNREHSAPRRLQESTESRAFRETFSRTVPIHFLGVWDTVSSVGWIWDPVKLLYDGQNPIMRKGRHAISVDERRCFFQAMAWGEPLSLDHSDLTSEEREKLELTLKSDGWRSQDVMQAWFPGVHSDVGGSYCLNESGPALTAFEWMLSEARAAGLEVNGTLPDGLRIQPEKERAVFGRPSEHTGIQAWNSDQPEHPATKLHNSLKGPWWLLEPFPHKYFDQQGRKRWQFSFSPHSREIPKGALLHPALIHRLQSDPHYRPKNLRPEDIVPLNAENGPTLHPEIRQRLVAEQYGIFHPTATPATQPNEVSKVAAVACMLVGAAAYLFSRIKPNG